VDWELPTRKDNQVSLKLMDARDLVKTPYHLARTRFGDGQMSVKNDNQFVS